MNLKRCIALALVSATILGLASCGKGGTINTNDALAGQSFSKSDGFLGITSNSNSNMGMQYTDAFESESYISMTPNVEFNTESYDRVEENGFKAVSVSPLSTFGADVDTASYSNIRRMICDGIALEDINSDAVRIEELINYFKYDYSFPSSTEVFNPNIEIAQCPWNEETLLMRIGLQTQEIDWDSMPSSNLVLLVDTSGSMEWDGKLDLVKKALSMLIDNLTPDDRLSLVTYAGSSEIKLKGVPGGKDSVLKEAVEGLEAYGGTNGADGIETAYKLASEYFIQNGNNRVILVTDGDFNIGKVSGTELNKIIKDNTKNGIFLSVLGFGTGNIKDDRMEELADEGDGNYYYIDSTLEAKRVLVEEMGGSLYTVAKDAKFQVEFNPNYIKGYRLIGYENRLMDAEDFADDTKDGGEIGAGQQVTVLYEIVPIDSNFEIPNVDLKYQSSTPTDSNDWLTVSVRYKDPKGDKSKLLEYEVDESFLRSSMSTEMSFASYVAQFGMLLIDSNYKGTTTLEKLQSDLNTLNISDNVYREEFVELVNKLS